MVILAHFRRTFFAISRKVLGIFAFLKKQKNQCKILYPISLTCIFDPGPPPALMTSLSFLMAAFNNFFRKPKTNVDRNIIPITSAFSKYSNGQIK